MRHPSVSTLAATLTLVILGIGCDSTVKMRTSLRAGLDIDSDRLLPGLELAYVEDTFHTAAALADARAHRLGTIARVELPGIEQAAGFGLRFRGYLRVPYDDVYLFELTSDDRSQLYLNEQLVIDHDGYHGASTKTGAVALAKGHHRLRVLFFQAGGGRVLGLRVRRGDRPFAAVPDEWYYVDDSLVPGETLPLTDAP